MWSSNPSSVLLALTLSLVLLIPSISGLSSFGESCNRRKECNSTAGLRCLKGTCACENPDAQTFSEPLRLCVIKIGRRCGVSEAESSLPSSNLNETETENETATFPDSNSNTTDAICVENAECRKLKLRKWCRCKDGFIPNGHGTKCVPAAKYGEACSASSPCDKRSGTICLEEKCVCPFSDHQFFDQTERKCVSLANRNCSVPKISACVKNAECLNLQLRTGYSSEGVKKIHSKSVTQCHCKKGFSDTKDGHCRGMAETECGPSEPCNEEAFLFCVDGKCKCRNPLHETVDESGQCVSLVGSACSPTRPPCVENSACVISTCGCKEGFTMTPKKTCLLRYKEPCSPHQCNSHGGLACINGVCECFDSHLTYDEEAKACVVLSTSTGASASEAVERVDMT